MEGNTTPNTARGEVSLTINNEKHTLRFGMAVMRAITQKTGKGPSEIANWFNENFAEAASAVVAVAVQRYVKLTDFSQDDAADLIDELSPAETQELASALIAATTTVNPLLASMSSQTAAKIQALTASTPSENGATGLNSPTAS